MAGPIRNLVSRIRKNRPQRVQRRREILSAVLSPLDTILGNERAQRTRTFRSLGGSQSARSDLTGASKNDPEPKPRKLQDNPDGPDTAPNRAYDGDAMGPPKGGRVAKAVPVEDRSQDARPQVVRGETDSLPEPPKFGTLEHVALMAEDMLPTVSPEKGLEISAKVAAMRAQQQAYEEDKSNQDSARLLAGQSRSLADQAYEDGNWAALPAGLGALYPETVAPDARATAIPTITRSLRAFDEYVNQLQQVDVNNLPPEEAANFDARNQRAVAAIAYMVAPNEQEQSAFGAGQIPQSYVDRVRYQLSLTITNKQLIESLTEQVKGYLKTSLAAPPPRQQQNFNVLKYLLPNSHNYFYGD